MALDSDIVVNNSLEELYNIDFDDDYLAAAPSPNEKEYKKSIIQNNMWAAE